MQNCPKKDPLAECPLTCPSQFSDECASARRCAERVTLIEEGAKALSVQLHNSWTWYASRCQIIPGKKTDEYLDDFKCRLDW